MLCLFINSCDIEKNDNSLTSVLLMNENKIFATTGKVLYSDVEGGCYYIECENDTKYDPINLSDEYRHSGIIIKFKAKILDDVVGCCMIGKIIEIIDIQIIPLDVFIDEGY